MKVLQTSNGWGYPCDEDHIIDDGDGFLELCPKLALEEDVCADFACSCGKNCQPVKRTVTVKCEG